MAATKKPKPAKAAVQDILSAAVAAAAVANPPPAKSSAGYTVEERRILMTIFLDSYATDSNTSAGVRKAGISLQTYHYWRERSRDAPPPPEYSVEIVHDGHKQLVGFDTACEVMREHARSTLIAEAWRRAADGIDDPVYYHGVRVDTVKKFSDILLMFLIKQQDPSFRENATMNVGVQVGIVQLQDSARERLAQKLEAMLEATPPSSEGTVQLKASLQKPTVSEGNAAPQAGPAPGPHDAGTRPGDDEPML